MSSQRSLHSGTQPPPMGAAHGCDSAAGVHYVHAQFVSHISGCDQTQPEKLKRDADPELPAAPSLGMWPRDVHPKMNEAKRSQRETSRSLGVRRLSSPTGERLQERGVVLSSKGSNPSPSQNPGCQRCTRMQVQSKRRAGSVPGGRGLAGTPVLSPSGSAPPRRPQVDSCRNPAVRSSLSHCPPLITRQVAESGWPWQEAPRHCPQLLSWGWHWEEQPPGSLDAQSPERQRWEASHLHFQDAARGAPPVQLPRRKGHCSETKT